MHHFNILLVIYIIGFISNFIGVYVYNIKYKVLSKENIFLSYILFLIFFFVFSKIGYILINYNLEIKSIFNFITSGYAFIGGYIGCLLFIFIATKIFNIQKYDLMKIYLPNMILLYSILKICCFINGCCSGRLIIPIQLIESFFNMILYLYICYLVKNDKSIINISLIGFGLLRLILSIFRIYVSIYTFIVVEILCIFIIVLGIKYSDKKEKNKYFF